MPAPSTLAALREQVNQLQGGIPKVPLPVHPALSGVVPFHTGGTYQVDNASLALSLLAGSTSKGNWVGVVGVNDLGVEAAADLGVDLSRVVLVPEPGEHWLEATAALVDVAQVVLLRPPWTADSVPAPTTLSRLRARLRKRATALVCWGEWPGAEVRLSLRSTAWIGASDGHGRLQERSMVVECHRRSAGAESLLLSVREGTLIREPTVPVLASVRETA